MKCVHCKRSVHEKDVKFFLQVMVCPVCRSTADMARDRVRSELEAMLARLDASFRSVLTNDKPFSLHHCATADRKTVLELAIQLDGMSCQTQCPPETTKLNVPTADGKSSSSSLKAVD